MPIIRCRLAKDGKLIPTMVEFEPGETILFKSDHPVHVRRHDSKEIKVLGAFGLDDISAHGEAAGLQISVDGRVADYQAPPPPPPHIPSVTVFLDAIHEGELQAGVGTGA